MSYLTWIYCFIGGVCFSLGFPNALVPGHRCFMPAALFGVWLFFYSCTFQNTFQDKKVQFTLKKNIGKWLCFSFAFNLTSFYWIPETLRIFGDLPFPFQYVLSALFTLVALPQFLFFVLWKTFLPKKSWIHTPLTFAFLMAVTEYFLPQQFPISLGHSWMALAPYLPLAPIIGVVGYSFVSYWIIFSFQAAKKRWPWPTLVSCSLLLIFHILFPLQNLNGLPKNANANLAPYRVRIVQANVGNFMKVLAEKNTRHAIDGILKKYSDLSLRDKNLPPFDLLVWPETAYPFSLYVPQIKNDSEQTPQLFLQILEQNGGKGEILFGAYEERFSATEKQQRSQSFEELYNAAIFINHHGEVKQSYQKHVLIPFGETLPFGPLNAFIGPYIENISFFSAGREFQQFTTHQQKNFMVAICYELLFSSFIRDMLNSAAVRPHFLINLTNDSWYGDTAEPYQHLYLAKWRALEFQLPVIRSTNTGISEVIFTDGSDSQRLLLQQAGAINVPLYWPSQNTPTPYERWGLMVSAFIFIGAHFLRYLYLLLFKRLKKYKK